MTRTFSSVTYIILLIFISLYSINSKAQDFSFFKTTHTENFQPPKHEVRAVWLTTIGGLDWPHCYAQNSVSIKKQQQELINILNQLEKAGINTILLQTRIRGTVIYPSALESWDGCLSGVPGKSPGYDALQFAIDECHKRGMEVHAWMVTIPVGKWNGLGVKQLRKKFPNLILKIGDEGYMNPEHSQTAHYMAEICEEVTRNYDIDGIHLDYIRYPETWNRPVRGHEGRKNITQIVEAIHKKVKAIKPWVKMSCSPIGKSDDLSRYPSRGWNAYSKVHQDAQGWLKNGLMDALFPMMYFQGNNFYPFAIDWIEQSYGRMVVPGLGIYFLSPKEKNWSLDVITREMQMSRQYGMGHAFFRSKFFTDDIKGLYQFTRHQFNHYPALIPPMTWQHSDKPMPPTSISLNEESGKNVMTWSGAKDKSNAPYLLYNVYSSKDYPVNTHDARNLIAVRRKENHIALPPKSNERYYAVTAIDRYGNESEAVQSVQVATKVHLTQMLACDGQYVELPLQDIPGDVKLVTIENMTGITIASKAIKGMRISVVDLDNGIYNIRTLNKKGVSHRIGYFMIRRDGE